ncbi:MAG: alpha/beta fold hydrolase [Hyphomicrobiaceae bacterium]
MPTVEIDGIATRYEVQGKGPPLLMFAPAGYNASLEKWDTQGVYARTRMMQALRQNFTCIVFDRRECGESGGRIERISWRHFVNQAAGLLDHLGVDRAHTMGGCIGCPQVAAMGVMKPERVKSMVLYWPVGGARFRIGNFYRFGAHIAFLDDVGFEGVVEYVASKGDTFGNDPKGGPWALMLKHDKDFAAAFVRQDKQRYKQIVLGTCRILYDRDTAPGAEPEDLMQLDIPALIVPGKDNSHATSAARYLEECIAGSEYWDVLPADQTEANVPARLVEFLQKAEKGA